MRHELHGLDLDDQMNQMDEVSEPAVSIASLAVYCSSRIGCGASARHRPAAAPALAPAPVQLRLQLTQPPQLSSTPARAWSRSRAIPARSRHPLPLPGLRVGEYSTSTGSGRCRTCQCGHVRDSDRDRARARRERAPDTMTGCWLAAEHAPARQAVPGSVPSPRWLVYTFLLSNTAWRDVTASPAEFRQRYVAMCMGRCIVQH